MKTLFEKLISFPNELIRQLGEIKNELASAHATYKAGHAQEKREPIVLQALLSRPQSEINENERRHEENRGYQNRHLLIQAAGIFITFIIAIATFFSAKAAKDAAQISRENADATLRLNRLEQRAWIGTNVDIIPVAKAKRGPISNPLEALIGVPFDIRVAFKNTGKTPAFKIKQVLVDVSIPANPNTLAQPDFTYKPEAFGSSIGTLQPGAVSYSDSGYTMDRQTFEQITSLRRRIYVHGRVEYDDAFEAHHWYNFCTYMTAGGAFATCPFHNEMDQNPN